MPTSITPPPQPRSMARKVKASKTPESQKSPRNNFKGEKPRSTSEPINSGEMNAAMALQANAGAMYDASPAAFKILLNGTLHIPAAHH